MRISRVIRFNIEDDPPLNMIGIIIPFEIDFIYFPLCVEFTLLTRYAWDLTWKLEMIK